MLEELQKLGLSEKEAKVYLAALELGPSSVQEIARKAGLSRATVYFQIENLIKEGLMSSFLRKKKRYFSAESPEKLLRFLEIEERKIKEKREEFKKIFPELQTIFSLAEEKPKVRFFEGKEGLKSIQEDILKSKPKSLEEFIPLDDSYRIFPPHKRDHRELMAKKMKNVPIRVIYTSQKGFKPKKSSKTQIRFIPSEKLPFHTEIVIYGNKTAFCVHKGKLLGVIIESKEISDSLRSIFNLAWQAAKKY